MATLSVTAQAQLQDVIDLMLKGTARETPVAEDVIERLALIAKSEGVDESGAIYEAVRDRPVSTLIVFVSLSGEGVLTHAQQAQLEDAANLMGNGTAYETPFAEDVIQRLAPVAAQTGFLTVGGFYENIKDRPVSTMLQWSLFLGQK